MVAEAKLVVLIDRLQVWQAPIHASLRCTIRQLRTTQRATVRGPTPPGKKTSGFVSTGAQYRAPTSQEGAAMKLGPGPKGA